MRIPLHLGQWWDDNTNSIASAPVRLQLHLAMSQLNPKGWRQPSGKKGRTKKSHGKRTRIERLQSISQTAYANKRLWG